MIWKFPICKKSDGNIKSRPRLNRTLHNFIMLVFLLGLCEYFLYLMIKSVVLENGIENFEELSAEDSHYKAYVVPQKKYEFSILDFRKKNYL